MAGSKDNFLNGATWIYQLKIAMAQTIRANVPPIPTRSTRSQYGKNEDGVSGLLSEGLLELSIAIGA